MYKRGMTLNRFKAHLRNFWTDKWKYERTPQGWIDEIFGETKDSNKFTLYGTSTYRTNQKALLYDALDKLVLEKKINKEKAKSMWEMISSPDSENAYMAISMMAALKPNKFKKQNENN